jgi:hypothetical protein
LHLSAQSVGATYHSARDVQPVAATMPARLDAACLMSRARLESGSARAIVIPPTQIHKGVHHVRAGAIGTERLPIKH